MPRSRTPARPKYPRNAAYSAQTRAATASKMTEPAPGEVQHPRAERHDRAPAGDEAAHQDQLTAAFTQLPPCPGKPLTRLLTAEETPGDGGTEAAADQVTDVVAGHRPNGGRNHDQQKRQVTGGRDDPGRDHGRLARHYRQDGVQQSKQEDHRISPSRRVGDVLGELVEHESTMFISQTVLPACPGLSRSRRDARPPALGLAQPIPATSGPRGSPRARASRMARGCGGG